jgi:hypothetical protein
MVFCKYFSGSESPYNSFDFAEYAIYRLLNRKSLLLNGEVWLSKLIFLAASSLLIFAIVVYVQQIWITLSIILLSVFVLGDED